MEMKELVKIVVDAVELQGSHQASGKVLIFDRWNMERVIREVLEANIHSEVR